MNPDAPAFPTNIDSHDSGISIRIYIATAALQGLLANHKLNIYT